MAGDGHVPPREGMTGIEPASLVWKTKALPLSYIPAVLPHLDPVFLRRRQVTSSGDTFS